ncbi:MAG: FtsX-like permease family protein [Chitinophagales bacterium]
MNLPFKIAWRYLFSKKSTNAINIISYISMVGMGLGAMVLVVLLSVFNGFEDLVVELQSSFYADIEIKPTEGKTFEATADLLQKIEEIEGVEAICKVLEENAYVTYKGKSAIAKIKGYDQNFDKVNDIKQYIIYGSDELKDADRDYALLGAGLFYTIEAKNNEAIRIAIPKKGKTSGITAAQLFNTASIVPGGVFGIQTEFDNTYILTDINFVQKLQRTENQISAVEVKAKPNVSLKSLSASIKNALGGNFTSTTRVEQNQALYKAMQAERFVMIAILFLVLLIISFTIVGALSMLVMEKRLDISILKAMGANNSMVFKVFITEGIIGALIGAGIGAVLGVIIVLLQQYFGFIKLGTNGGFVIDAYPVKLELLDVFIAFIMVFIISLLASWFPAKRAANNSLAFVKN